MSDSLRLEDIQRKFEVEFKELHSNLESLSVLYRNLQVHDAQKKLYLEKTLKTKSAWYACLVNSNIDVLLLPEYLESKQSRNILIKKETEQYFQSVSAFHLLTVQNNASIYDCILFSEDVEPKSSFDLFSSQAPESANCPLALKRLFERCEKQFSAFSTLENTIYSFLEWHKLNQFSFSGQRQCILWLNYQFWKFYGNVFQKLNLEKFLFEKWNREQLSPVQALSDLIDFLNLEIKDQKEELLSLYRSEIGYDQLKSRQKLISTYMFENQFKLEFTGKMNQEMNALIRILQRKGFITLSDFQDRSEAEKHMVSMQELLKSELVICAEEQEEVCLFVNTSIHNKKLRLFAFQNIQLKESGVPLNAFIHQSQVKPIIPIEKPKVSEPQLKETVQKRQKAFFG